MADAIDAFLSVIPQGPKIIPTDGKMLMPPVSGTEAPDEGMFAPEQDSDDPIGAFLMSPPMNPPNDDGNPPPAPSGGKRRIGADEALVRNFAQGVTFNTADEISSGIMAGVDALRGEDLGDSYDRRLASARAQDAEIAEQRPVLSVVGQAAGGLATLPAGIAARGATGGARILQAAAQGAGYGAASGFGAGEGGLENRANSAAGGAVTGAVFGGGAQGLGEGAKAAGKAILPEIGKEVATLAQRAKEFGIPVSMQQIAPGKIRNTLQKVSQAIPLSGVKGFEEQQTQSWNKALAKTLGEESDNLGPETIQNFLSKSSDGFDNVLKGKSVQVDPLNVETLDTLVENSKGSLSDSLVKVIQKNVDDLKANIGADNVIPGEKLASFRSELLKRIGRAEGGAKEYLGDVVDVVDDLLDTSLDDASKEALGKLRRQWRNYRTVEPLLEKSATGEVNPTSLLNRVASSPYIKASRLKTGDDDLVDLARIGKDLLPKLGGSDTFEKTSLGAGIATTALNPVIGAKILGGVALNRAFQSFYNQSGKAVDAAIRKSLGDKAEPAIKLLSKGAPLDVVTKAISKSGAGDDEIKEAVEYISRMASKAKDGVPIKSLKNIGQSIKKGFDDQSGSLRLPTSELPMDNASRMTRAKAMGFDTANPVYHGTTENFDSFKAGGLGQHGEGVYFSPNTEFASTYAGGESAYPQGNVIKAFVKGNVLDMTSESVTPKTIKILESITNKTPEQINKAFNTITEMRRDFPNQFVKDANGVPLRRLIHMLGGASIIDKEKALSAGISRVKVNPNEVLVFDPKNIRSVNAKFDPAKANSANILASRPEAAMLAIVGLGATGGLLSNEGRKTRIQVTPKGYNPKTGKVE